MLFEKDRKRRVIYNDDADQQFNSRLAYPYDITDERSFIDARTHAHLRHARGHLRLVRRKRRRTYVGALGRAEGTYGPSVPGLTLSGYRTDPRGVPPQTDGGLRLAAHQRSARRRRRSP